MKRIALILCTGLVFAGCCCNLGCAYANPALKVSGPGGWSADASTNAEVVIDKLDAAKTADGGSFKADKISVKSDAAIVREANVKQMQAHTEQIKAGMEGMAKIVDEAMPMLPWNVAAAFMREFAKVNAQVQVADKFAASLGESAKTPLPVATSQPAK